jgi:hypothetical protein
MAQRDRSIDDDVLPVMVPRNDRKLVPKSSERVRRLRAFLIRMLRTTKELNTASRVRPEPEGFGAEVARAACSLCGGWCCKNGGDDAFLDEPTIARVRHAVPALGARAVLRLYVERVPAVSYEGSCIFHGERGCTLDRSLRSDLCNAYFCGGLQAYLTSSEPATATVVIAGEGNKMRTSPVIVPRSGPPNNDRRRT